MTASIVITGRDAAALDHASRELARSHGVEVRTAAGDITTDAGQAAALAACPAPDILINNAAGPPLGDWRTFGRDQWLAAADANMVAAILLTRAVIDGMAERRFGRIVNITSTMLKAPIAPLALSVAARLGLTGFVKAVAGTYAPANVTINNLLPELFETDRLRSNLQKIASAAGHSVENERERRRSGVPAGRFGHPEEFGAVCAFYCSAHTGYITGQNILLDGGQYAGTF